MGEHGTSAAEARLRGLERRQRALLTRMEQRRGHSESQQEPVGRVLDGDGERLGRVQAERDAARVAWSNELAETEKLRAQLLHSEREFDRVSAELRRARGELASTPVR